MDTLKIAADSVADTLANVAQTVGTSHCAVCIDAFNCTLILAAILSICAIVGKTVRYFIKKKVATQLKVLPEVIRRNFIKELLWVFATVISGSAILIVSWNKDYNTNNLIFAVTIALSLGASLFFIFNFIKTKRYGGSNKILTVVEKIIVEFLWIFWLVLSGYYITSEFMDFKWGSLISLWQNRIEDSSRLTEDLIAILIVTTRFVLLTVKYRQVFKRGH